MQAAAKATLAGLCLVLTSVLAGCTAGGPSFVKQKFRDADQRVAQSANGGYAEFWEIVVPASSPALTVRAALSADDGITFELRDPAARANTRFNFLGDSMVDEMSWVQVQRPAAGTWRLSVECGRQCDFAFGFYLRDAVPKAVEDRASYEDALQRFEESTAGSSTRSNEFEVPKGLDALAVAFHVRSDDDFAYSLKDPSGILRSRIAFPSHATVNDARILVMREPPPGVWTFDAACRDGCEYAFGLYGA